MSFVKKSTHLQRYTTEGHPDLGRKMDGYWHNVRRISMEKKKMFRNVKLSNHWVNDGCVTVVTKKCEALLDKHGKPEDGDKNIIPFIYGVHCRPCEIMWMWMCHKAKNRRTNLMPLSQQSSNVACRTLSSSLWFLGTEKPIHAHGPKIGYDWIMLGISPAIFWNTWVPYCQCRAHMLYTYMYIHNYTYESMNTLNPFSSSCSNMFLSSLLILSVLPLSWVSLWACTFGRAGKKGSSSVLCVKVSMFPWWWQMVALFTIYIAPERWRNRILNQLLMFVFKLNPLKPPPCCKISLFLVNFSSTRPRCPWQSPPWTWRFHRAGTLRWDPPPKGAWAIPTKSTALIYII